MPSFVSLRVFSEIKAVVITLNATHASSGRVDITELGTITPLMLNLDKVSLNLGVDYQITPDSGSVYLEFINEMAPAGVSAIEAGEVITFLYAADPA